MLGMILIVVLLLMCSVRGPVGLTAELGLLPAEGLAWFGRFIRPAAHGSRLNTNARRS